MLPFIIGTLTGSVAMLFTMILMIPAKRADEQSEMMLKEAGDGSLLPKIHT